MVLRDRALLSAVVSSAVVPCIPSPSERHVTHDPLLGSRVAGIRTALTHRRRISAGVVFATIMITLLTGLWLPIQSEALASNLAIPAEPAVLTDTVPAHDATVGTVAGQSDVQGGAAIYSIPIAVPPGRAGMQPAISLDYSSRGGNGIAGMGWSLSGSSAIHRCSQTFEQDGRTQAVSYTADDRLCLNGQRLVRVAGSAYGLGGAEYRTEIDSYARITQAGGGLTGNAACFKVEQRSGNILHYGGVVTGSSCVSSRNARVQPTNAAGTMTWLIEKEEDRAGNNVYFNYTNFGDGEVLLSRVDYTGYGSATGDRSVRMTYGSRPASALASIYDADISSSYLAGGRTMQTQRLQRIDTYESLTSKVASWKLDYVDVGPGTSRTSGRSLLRAVNQCATVSGVETCLSQPTRFQWKDISPHYAFKALNLPGLPQSVWTVPDAQIELEVLEELQRDQLEELAQVGRINPTPADLPIPNLDGAALGSVLGFSTVADFDGDGTRESLAKVQTSAGQKTYLIQMMADRSVRNAVDVSGQLFVFPDNNSYEVADIDGDGRAEMLSWTNPLSFLAWAAPAGQVPGNPIFNTAMTSIPSAGSTTLLRARLGDFDGDGKPDLVTFAPHASCGSDGAGLKNGVFIHRNNITSAPVGSTAAFVQSTTPIVCLSRSSGSTGEYVERIADFDGDGLPDLFLADSTNATGSIVNFSRIMLVRSNGSTITTVSLSASALGLTSDEQSRTANRVAHWMDINGDGLDDFVFAQSAGTNPAINKWTVRLNQGGTLSASINTGSSAGLKTVSTVGGSAFRYANRLPQMDVDGDGRIDLLAPSGFAARVCAYTSEPPNGSGECPLGATNNMNQCVVYMCPEDTNSDAMTMPSCGGLPCYNGIRVKRMYENNKGALDDSSYKLNVLRFVQTGAATVVVQEVESGMAASLNRNAPEDTYGDGLTDLVNSVGCRFSEVGAGVTGFTPCLLVADGVHGPSQLPNGQSLTALNPGGTSYYFENHYSTFINEGRGVEPGISGVPRVPDLIQNVVNGLDTWTAWRYSPLSMPGNTAPGIPFYSVPASGRYVDARHFYFTSTMPAVQVMTQSSGAVDKEDPTIAGGSRSWFYGYQEAMYNRLGRGFQGFRGIVKSQLLPDTRGVRVTTLFHQKFPLTGRVETEETAPLNKPTFPIRRETNTWRCGLNNRAACPALPPIPQNTVYTPFLDRQVAQSYDLAASQANSSALVGTVTTLNASSSGAAASGWDAWGNLRNQLVTTSDGATGGAFVSNQVVGTTNSYTIDATAWWVNKLDTSTVTTSIAYASGHALPAGAGAPARTVSKSFAWNSNRTPQSQTVQPGVPNQQVTTSYGYPTPSYGLPTSVTATASGASPTSRLTGLSYSNNGTSVATDGYFVLQTTNAAGHVTTTETRPRDGQVSRVIAPTGLRTLTTYDPFGRPTRIDAQTTTGAALEPSIFISQARCNATSGSCPGGYGEGEGQSFAAIRTTTVKAGAPTQVTWSDKLGRPVKQSVRGFNGTFVQTLTEYDTSGQVTRQSTPHFAGSSPWWTTFNQYDHLNRVIQKTAPASEMDAVNGNLLTKYTYSGTQTKIRVQGSAFSSSAPCPVNRPCMEMWRWHDALGRLMKTQDALGGLTRYWYDGAGNPVAAEDAEGHRTLASYNDIGQRLNRNDPDAGYASFTYDAFGQVLTQTDARNVTTTNTYDALGRLIQRASTNPAGAGLPAESVVDTWQYDFTAGPGLLDTQKRQRGSGLPTVWQEAYAYEPTTKRPSSQTTTMEGEAWPWVTGFSYDTAGHEATVTYPSGLVIRKGYTADGYLNNLKRDTDNFVYWTATSQDAWGNVTGETVSGVNTGTHQTYASSGQWKQKRWTRTWDSQEMERVAYLYDTFGNLKRQERGNAYSVYEQYTYDRLQRLTLAERMTAVGPSSTSYTYTADGNISFKGDYGAAYEYAGAGCPGRPHFVTKVFKGGTGSSGGSDTFTCDANGNVNGGETLTGAVYDFQNQALRLQRYAVGSSDFRYGADSQRYREVSVDGIQTTITSFGARGYEKSISGSSTILRHEIGPVTIRQTDGGSFVPVGQLRDRLGSTLAQTSATGSATNKRGFDSFGAVTYGDFSPRVPATLGLAPTTLRGFTGHEHVDSTRVIHMNGRIYDPKLGRFYSVDPVIQFPSNSQSLNPYSYILNNPLSGRDPSGYASQLEMRTRRIMANTEGSCMGAEPCQEARDKAFLGGPAGALRNSLTEGGAPTGMEPRNGADLLNKIKVALDTPTDKIGTVIVRPIEFGEHRAVETPLFQRTYEKMSQGNVFEQVTAGFVSNWVGETWGAYFGGKDAYGGSRNPISGEYMSPQEVRFAQMMGMSTLVFPEGKMFKAGKSVTNVVPSTLARIIPGKGPFPTLGPPGRVDVFVTAADDIAGLTPTQLSQRLGIPASDTFSIIRFPTPSSGLASPVNRLDPGFIGGGLTSGGAREFVLPNGPIPPNALIEILVP